MFTSYHLTRALVADRQRTLHDEARHHRLARMARLTRTTRRRPVPPGTPPSTPEARPARPVPSPRRLPPAAALAAWQQDQRAA